MKFTPEQRYEMARRYSHGERAVELAREYHCSRSYLVHLSKHFKMEPVKRVWARGARRAPHSDVGKRVRVNETFPSGGHGRLGTIIGADKKRNYDALIVLFDDNPKHPAKWARRYFDFLDATETNKMPGGVA